MVRRNHLHKILTQKLNIYEILKYLIPGSGCNTKVIIQDGIFDYIVKITKDQIVKPEWQGKEHQESQRWSMLLFLSG